MMRVSRRKFGFDSDEVIDVVNLKLSLEMFGSFGSATGFTVQSRSRFMKAGGGDAGLMSIAETGKW